MAMQIDSEVINRIADRAFPGVEAQEQPEAPAPAPELANEPSEVQAFPGEGQRVAPQPKQEEAPAPAPEFKAEYEDLGDTAMPHKDTMLQAAQKVNDFWDKMQMSVVDEQADELNGTLDRLHKVANGLNLAPKDIFHFSKKSGLSASMVDNDPQFAQLKIASDEYAKSLKTFASAMDVSENTITFLYENGEDVPAQLILTKDNTILNTERELREAKKGFSVRNFFSDRALGGAMAGNDNMSLIHERNNLKYESQFRDLTPQEQERVRLLDSAISAYGARRKKDDVGIWNDLTWATGESVVGTMGNLAYDALTKGAGTIAAGAGAGAALGSSALGVGMLPGMAMGAGAGLTAEMVGGMYKQAVGDFINSLEEMEKEGGVTFDKDMKRNIAMWGALPYTGAEYVGLKSIGKFLPKGVSEFFTKEAAQKTLEFIKAHPTVASRLGESAMRMLAGMAGEVGTEIFQDMTVNAGKEIARLKTPELNLAPRTWGKAFDDYMETAKETTKGLILPGVFGFGARFNRSQNNAARYENTLRMLAETQDKLTNIIHKASTSTTMQDAPEIAQGLMRRLADGDQLPATTYIAPEKLQGLLFQTENPDPEMMKAAEKLGITPESLEENLALGTDVAIDTVDLMGTKLMQDENVFNKLKNDLKYHPEMKTAADLDAFEEGMKDEQLRAEWLDDILEPIRDEENEALARAEVREEMMSPYFDQLKMAGYSDQKARAYTDLFARMAERFAPIFGEAPAQYLEKRFAGFMSMTPQEFIDVRSEGDIGRLFDDRNKAAALEGWGIKRNMTFPQIRRIIDPAFRAAYGRVSKTAFERAYGKAGVETAQKQFGPGFWGKRGKARGLDVIAQESYEYNGDFGGSVVDADTYNSGVDVEKFWEKVMRPHDDVVGSFMSQFQQELGGDVNQNDGAGPVRWQLDDVDPISGESYNAINGGRDYDTASLIDEDGRVRDSIVPGELGDKDRASRIADEAVRAVRLYRRNDVNVRSYTRRGDGSNRRPYFLKSLQCNIQGEWVLSPEALRVFTANGMAVPSFYELATADKEAATKFAQAVEAFRQSNPDLGVSLSRYSDDEYADMRLFLTGDGAAGLAVKKNGDIVSVFSRKTSDGKPHNGGMAAPLLELAVSAGGRKLDCFDTILPRLYSRHGFRAIVRNKWNSEYKPEGWDKSSIMRRFNGGEPDVVYMVYDPNYFGQYSKGDGAVVSGDGTQNQLDALAKIQDHARQAGNPLFQIAYHGTGNNFDQFTLDHIGEGEGAQAHGWGLYFAQDRDVAEGYRTKLGGTDYTYKGRDLNTLYGQLERKGEWDKLGVLEDFMVKHNPDAMDYEDYDPQAAKWFKDEVLPHIKSEGKLKVVDIPENDVLLDEDLALSKQDKNVKALVKKAKKAADDFWYKKRDELRERRDALKADKNAAKEDVKAAEDAFSNYNALGRQFDDAKDGRSLYNALAGIYGGAKEASLALNEVGIKGITYDGQQDGRCFVVFDNKAINILQTFYQTKDGKVDLKNAQGAMRKLADGRYMVGLFQKQNASTVIHELSHVWLEMFREAVQQENCPDWVQQAWKDTQKALKFDGLLLSPEEDAAWTTVQENWARQFEAYCREGKAPTWELQAAFNLFRNWLTEVYRSIKRLLAGEGINQEINPDVQEVFDRLLATQEEIDASQRSVESGSVMSMLDNVEPELKDKYAKAVEKARQRASAIVANRHLVDRRRAEKEFMDEANAVLAADDDYYLLAQLREKGIQFDAIKGLGNDNVIYELQRKWGSYKRPNGGKVRERALFRKDGELTDIDDIAAQFNENDAWGLLSKLQELPTENEAVQEYVAQRMREWEAAYEAEIDYSAEYDEALAVEVQALTGVKQASSAALRREMEMRTGVKKLADVDREYTALKQALRRDARVAKRAATEGRREGFAKGKALSQKWKDKLAEMKQRERVQRAALFATYKARLERDKIVRQVRKIAKSKSVPYEFKQQILRIIGNWQGLGSESMRVSNEDARSMQRLDAFLATHTTEAMFANEGGLQEMIQTLCPDFLMSGEVSGRMADLSIEKLRQIKATIDELAHLGRISDKMLAQKREISIENAAQECAASMNKLSAKKFISERDGIIGRMQSALRGGLSSLTAQRFMQRALDGFKKEGANFDNWFAPLQKAVTNELVMYNRIENELMAIMSPLVQRWQNMRPFTIEGVPLSQQVSRRWGGMWDMQKVFTVALNMGNEGNLNALMRGYGWSEQQLNAIVSRLTEEEWDAVQKVWDTVNSMYEPLNNVHKELKGAPLKKVAAKPFNVQMPDGKVKRLEGGYYPLQFDQDLSDKAREQQDSDAALNNMFNVFRASPSPASGFTKERTGGALPPRLDLNVLLKHVRDTTHYVTHALPLRDAVQLFQNETFREAFIRAAGEENYKELNPWLKSLARPDGTKLGGMNAVMEYLGRQSTAFALGLNMKTAAMQFTSIGNSFNEVGFGNFMKACMVLTKQPLRMWNMIKGKSAYMNNRTQMRDETLRQMYKEMEQRGITGVRFGRMTHTLDTVRKAQFWLITAIDGMVAMPTWQAEYEKQIAAGKSEEDAVAAADGAVVAAQSGGGVLDTAAVMRNAGFMRLICPFMSFALGDFNRKMYHVRGYAEYIRTKGEAGIDHGEMFKHFALEWVLPVLMTCLITGLGRDGELPDEKDLLWEALTFYTMGIPVLRDFAKFGQGMFGHGFSGGSPLWLSSGDNAWRFIKYGFFSDNEDANYKALKAAINSIAAVLGIGTPQIWRTLEGSEAQFVDGKGGVFAFLLGKPQEKKKN